MTDPIKTTLQGEIGELQHTCPVNQETVFGISSCKECEGYEMCTASNEGWLYKIN